MTSLLRLLPCIAFASVSALAEIKVPAFTAYIHPDPDGARVSKEGVTGWTDETQHVQWYGELKATGALSASVQVKGADDAVLRLSIGEQKVEAKVVSGVVTFGGLKIEKPGYVKFDLERVRGDVSGVEAILLDGPATVDAHFNLDPRRNAASVHLMYPILSDSKVVMFYNEVTAVEDPVATYYMACGFSRGYFGMQVNSLTERRIIFSVWDAGNGGDAKDRSTVAADDQTQLIAKGEGVEAHVFGNEGTGGHSHFVYPWKTGEAQKFVVTAKVDGTHTTYSGYWLHPERKTWMLLASFRAPKDGKYLRGLYSFSENFGGANGHLRRKALFGPQWVADESGRWSEIREAKFSHDPTGKANRLDRFMGVEDGKFFLSQGGFVEGFTKYGEPFSRPSSASEPHIVLPTQP